MGERSRLRFILYRLRLVGCAWRLHGVAQRLARNEPLPTTREALLEQGFLPKNVDPRDALWAAGWAARGRRRLFGQLDTCLLRSLVAGALVADGPDVAVRIGVHRPQPAGTPDGALANDLLKAHAWLTVADRELAARGEEVEGFEEVLVLPMERA